MWMFVKKPGFDIFRNTTLNPPPHSNSRSAASPFRVELTKLDLCANYHLSSFSRDFRAPDLNFPCKWMMNGTPPSLLSAAVD